ncbi:MAG: hypothetical protein R3F11_09210 [Verrucomicrobiales bacterium]
MSATQSPRSTRAPPPPGSARSELTAASCFPPTSWSKSTTLPRAVVNGVDITVRSQARSSACSDRTARARRQLHMIVGLVEPDGGEVTFAGQDATRLPMAKRARLSGMGWSQEESIFRKLKRPRQHHGVDETRTDLSRKERKQSAARA